MFTPDGQALLAVAKLPDNESTRRHLIATDTSGLSETGFRPADPAFRTLETTSVGFHSLVGSLSHSRFAVVDQSGRILVFDSQSLQLLTSIAGNFASGKGLAFVDRNTLGISTGDAFHTIDLSNPEASLTTPSDDAKNSNHLVYDFTQSRMFVSHARAKNQLTVWHLSSRTVDAGGFAGHPAGPIPGMEVAIDSSSMQPQESVAETEPIEVTSPVEKRIDQGTFHPADLAARLWTDTRSSKQIEANFIGIDGDEVLLRRSNADEIIVSRQRLAGADQKFLDEILETFPATTDFKSFAETQSRPAGATRLESKFKMELHLSMKTTETSRRRLTEQVCSRSTVQCPIDEADFSCRPIVA
ncbi:hypothetical protein C2E31_02065 [Rhodopirellula baltica]|nr:hypothetical protein C2E31_02065 [Rhodopirellula baltica]